VDRDRLADSLLSVFETFAALAACVGICFVVAIAVALVWAPPTWTVEIPMRPLSSDAAHPSDVALRVADLELPDGVDVMTAQQGAFLVLTGLPSRRFPAVEVREILAEAGYGVSGTEGFSPSVDPEAMLRKLALPYLTIQAGIFILAGLLLARFRVRPQPGRPQASLPAAVGMGLAAGLGMFFTSLLIAGLLTLLGLEVTEQQWVLDLLGDRDQLIRLVPWLVLLVPVSEEVFFRGYMYRRIEQHAGTAAGMAVSAVTFALIHFNLSGFPVYVVIGLILAWVYRRTGSLAAPIAGHVLYNSIALLSAIYFPAP